jgi:hypothetical protein
VEDGDLHGDRLVELRATLDAKPWAKAALVRRPDADEAARRLYEGWLGEPFKAPSA